MSELRWLSACLPGDLVLPPSLAKYCLAANWLSLCSPLSEICLLQEPDGAGIVLLSSHILKCFVDGFVLVSNLGQNVTRVLCGPGELSCIALACCHRGNLLLCFAEVCKLCEVIKMQVPLEETKSPPNEQETTPNVLAGSESRFPIDSTNSQAGLLIFIPDEEGSIQVEDCGEEPEPDLLKEELYKRFNRRLERIKKNNKKEFVSRVGEALTARHDQFVEEILTQRTKIEALDGILSSETIPVGLSKVLTALVDTSASIVEREVTNGATRVGAKGSTKLAHWEVQCDKLEAKLKVLQSRSDFERAVLDRESIKKITKLRQHQAVRFSKKMREMSQEYHDHRREVARKAIEKAEEAARLEDEREQITKLQQLEAHRDRASSAISIMQVQRQERMRERLDALSREREKPKQEPLYEKLNKQFSKQQDMLYYDRGRTTQEIEMFMRKKRQQFHKNRNRMKLEEILFIGSGLDEPRNLSRGLATIPEMPNRDGSRYRSSGLSGSIDLTVHYARLPTVKYTAG